MLIAVCEGCFWFKRSGRFCPYLPLLPSLVCISDSYSFLNRIRQMLFDPIVSVLTIRPLWIIAFHYCREFLLAKSYVIKRVVAPVRNTIIAISEAMDVNSDNALALIP